MRLRCLPALLLFLLLSQLLRVLVREVMSHHASGRRSRHRVMTGEVTGNRAHRRTLETALGLHAHGRRQKYGTQDCGSQHRG